MNTSQEIGASVGERVEQRHECQRCGETLNPEKLVWLELSFQSGLYAASGSVPQKDSQGCFPFGAACARAVLKAGGRNKRTVRRGR